MQRSGGLVMKPTVLPDDAHDGAVDFGVHTGQKVRRLSQAELIVLGGPQRRNVGHPRS
jgi:hypothetical protein